MKRNKPKNKQINRLRSNILNNKQIQKEVVSLEFMISMNHKTIMIELSPEKFLVKTDQ